MTDDEWLQIEPLLASLDVAKDAVDAWNRAGDRVAFGMTDEAAALHFAAGPRLRAALAMARARYEAAIHEAITPPASPVILGQNVQQLRKPPRKDWQR